MSGDRSARPPFQIPRLFPLIKLIPPKEKKWWIFYATTGIGLLALVAIIVYTEVFRHSFPLRIDCNPDLPLNYDVCHKRGCIWVTRTNDYEPPCFFPEGYGYKILNTINTSTGYRISLTRHPDNVIFGDEVDEVDLIVFFETDKRVRLKFVDRNQKRYEVPIEVPTAPAEAATNVHYGVKFATEPQFGVQIHRLSSGTIIFDTSTPGMVFSNQFIQITTKLCSKFIYGLGEHETLEYGESVEWKKLSFFARNNPSSPGTNLNGVHPFYMNLEEDGNAHGVFLLNSNAMEFILQPYPALTFRTIGGILDFYVFLGPTPEEVVQQYMQVIGMPMMPPYWSLGFQLSRFGYRNIENVEQVMKRTTENEIPYDVQYFDIDYMKDFRIFTVDNENFRNLNVFMEKLHLKNIKTILALNPFVASNKTLKDKYPPLDVGETRHIFIQVDENPLEGNCWPGKVYYPDFTHPEVRPYWSQLCTEFRKLVQFDGLWILMNEPYNFVDGSLTGCNNNSLNFPPYPAGVAGSGKSKMLFEKTICMDADHHSGKHYDLHSLYGFFHANVTSRTLSIIIPGNRPMVLSGSTYPGSGRFVAHWLGDNWSTWSSMRNSIPSILEFNLFGIPFVGADICGFQGNSTEELCKRWMQLGAFYPFSRNHNSNDSRDQDPAAFGENVISAARTALLTRYELLPYLYTLFHLAHTKGSTVARPLLHEFPKDRHTWDIKYQFLWGPALLISPILHENVDNLETYFPHGNWYNFYNGDHTISGNGGTVIFLNIEQIKLHVRGGFILPLQTPNYTTTESRKQPLGLFVAPDENGKAQGQLFWDDGISYETQEQKKYLLLNFTYEKQNGEQIELNSTVIVNGYLEASQFHFGYLKLCRVFQPSSIKVNGVLLEKSFWNFDENSKFLHLTSLSIPINEKFHVVIYS